MARLPWIAIVLAPALMLPAVAQTPRLEIVAEMTEPPGNITVTPSGQIVVSLHQHYSPKLRVVTVEKDGSTKAFPDESWNSPGTGSALTFDSVLGLRSDAKGIVWLLDNGMRGKVTPKLVGWDARGKKLHRLIYLPEPVSRKDSFLNDLQVDSSHDAIYIADPSPGRSAALIVVDLSTGASRRVLEGHPSVTPEEIDLSIDGQPLEVKLPDGKAVRPRVGVNPISLDAANQWLVFGPMHGSALYRVRTADLLDETLSPGELGRRVEKWGARPVSDGTSMDNAGGVYITDIGRNAIGRVAPDGTYSVLFEDAKLLSWPDAFSFGPDGYLYLVSNQLHRGPALNGGKDLAKRPFYVLRFKPSVPGVAGR